LCSGLLVAKTRGTHPPQRQELEEGCAGEVVNLVVGVVGVGVVVGVVVAFGGLVVVVG